MNRYRALILVAVATLEFVLAATSLAAEEGWRTDERNKDMMLKYLRPALRTAGGIGRISYTTSCYKNGQPVPFPELRVRPAANGEKGLAAVRSVFRDDKNVAVVQDRSGMVRITIGKPASAILQTKIRSLALKPLDRYNPGLAIVAIEKAKEVQVAMEKLGLQPPEVVVLDMNVAEPAKGLPHLPATLADITVDQALDLVAKTFGGIAYYGVCADRNGKQLFSMDYFGVAGTEEEYGH